MSAPETTDKDELAIQRAKISKEIHELKDELFGLQNNEDHNSSNIGDDNDSGSDNDNENFYDVLDSAFEFDNKLENDQKISEVSQFLKEHERKTLAADAAINADHAGNSKPSSLKMLQSPSSFFNKRKPLGNNKKRNSIISSPIIDESSHSTNKFFNNVKVEKLKDSTAASSTEEDKEKKQAKDVDLTEEKEDEQPDEQNPVEGSEKEIVTYKKSFNEGNGTNNFQFDFEFSKLKINEEQMKFSDSVQKLAERSTEEINKQYSKGDDTKKKSTVTSNNRSSGSISGKLKRNNNNTNGKDSNSNSSKQLMDPQTVEKTAKKLMLSKSTKKKLKGGSTGGYVLSKILSIFGGK